VGHHFSDFVAFIEGAAIVEVNGGVVRIRERSGEQRIERTMSVKTARATVERIGRALERYARGDENVVVDD
jgi:hypothetical protein